MQRSDHAHARPARALRERALRARNAKHLDARTRRTLRARKPQFSLFARRFRARAISTRILRLVRALRARALRARSQGNLARSPLWKICQFQRVRLLPLRKLRCFFNNKQRISNFVVDQYSFFLITRQPIRQKSTSSSSSWRSTQTSCTQPTSW